MKHLLALLLGMSMAWSANAQNQESSFKKVAIISLIGDVMTIDTYRRRVGTSVDTNYQEIVALPEPIFDHAALGASEDALAKLIPATAIASLVVPTPGSDSDPSRLLLEGKVSPSNALISTLRQSGFTHLLAIGKHRAPARLQLAEGAVGSGYLKGIGFYIDNDFATKRSDTGETARGFIAPYVYIKLVLVDLDSLELRGEEVITASAVRAAARNKTGFNAWDAISPEEKVSMLRALLGQRISVAVPLLFRSR
jgi:hypothetical protein